MTQSKQTNQEKGKKGEDIACEFLENKGIRVLERNYHFERAEVDIVAYNGSQIIFAEVKTRTNTGHGEPEDAVDDRKKRSLYKVAEAWLYERKMDGAPVRFDVISILLLEPEHPVIKHFEGAFWYL